MKQKIINYIMAATVAIQDTKAVTGTVELFNDLSTVLMVLTPVIGPVLIGYFLLRKSAASEQEQHMWDKRAKTAGVCIVGIFVISGLIKAVCTYYQ